MNKIHLLILINLLVVLGSCEKDDLESGDRTIEYLWESGTEGWNLGYADYPANLTLEDSLNLFAMSFGHKTLPNEITPAQKGLFIAGANRSDDLFMYLYAPVENLKPSSDYDVTFELVLASKAPTNAIGIGGAPGEAVTLKVGAVPFKPNVIIDDSGWYRMNLDKSNQSQSGEDMIAIGHIGVADDTQNYALINRTNKSPLRIRTDRDGKLWLIMGTDSGFEGYTGLYYAQLKVQFKRV